LEFASDIVLPLVVDGRVLGTLSSVTRERRHWSPGDVEFATTVATHASIAIRNAELFATSESWAARLGVLQAASARMSRQNTIESVGRAIVEEVRRIIDYHNCRVYTLEPPDDLVAIAFEGTVGAYEKVDFDLLRTKLGEGFTGWAAQHGEALLIDDANADPRGVTIPGTDDVDESMLVVPMRYDEHVVGVIALSKLGLRQFDAGDLRLLAILADQAATALESARLLSRTERLTTELRWLLDMGSDLTTSLDPRQVADLIARHVGAALGAEACTVSAWDPRAEQLLTLGYWPEGDRAELPPVFDLRGYPLTRRVLREKVSATVDVDDPAADAAEVALLRSQGFNSLAMLPLVAKGESVGLVEIYTSASIEFDAPRLELARTMASEAAMALENARLYEATRELADHDQLTGFYNHRSVHERLGEELIRARRSRTPLAVLMIDLDGFKLVNDTFGHLFGDQVLAWTATQIRSSLRASDVAGRYGGDEFAIILPEADRAAAVATASRIRSAITEHPFESAERGPIPVGASIGVATYPVDGSTAPELLALADAAMYRVKREGDLPDPMGRPVPRNRPARAVPAGADQDFRTTG
jgi:diguanylate cyclase (GGDEF)-like protein